MNRRVQATAALSVATTMLLAACGGAVATPNGAANTTGSTNPSANTSSSGGSNTTGITSAPTTAPASGAAGSAVGSTSGSVPATAAAGSAASAPAAATGKVSANKASRAELQRAFEAAGIPNAARWAMEVEEYRPYPTNDPSWAKLRRELAKYNIAPATLEQIINTLALD
jgi:hypothetical protein